ncbi:DMT family transporter [Jannaschia sp. M317]|uniref:DMT family transporter n=1 Tax=Jannaschia sp. M317 TaxID=2867011 RepID=UPI0021A30377|nr:DMT family transporter [Jannaschia sp. M317]UWQ16582.1 DMT family transporter [Jannaschia sp. M317]
MTETIRGAGLMTVAMALFAIEDSLIKTLSGAFAPAQIVWMLGLGGALAFAIWLRLRGQPLWRSSFLEPQVLIRTGAEAVGSVLFISALAMVPLALAAAVLQATPLMVALGATLFLGVQVGWRRWVAILVGFGGVLIMLRPWSTGFEPAAFLAVGGMVALAIRDLATRRIPVLTSGVSLSLVAFASLVPAGFLVQVIQKTPFIPPDLAQVGILAACVAIGMAGYLCIVAGTRLGDIAIVSSFRYTRMLFALIMAVTFFGERPDGWTLVGVVIVIASGVFTLWREARARNAGSQT